MSSILDSMLTMINSTLSPIMPPGVTGVQYLSVFFIIYAITFIMLSKITLLSKNKAAQLIIALSIAFFTAGSGFSVLLITKLFPNLGIVTMILLSFLVVLSILTPSDKLESIKWAPLMTIAAIGLIVYGTWTSMGANINIAGLSMPQITSTEMYTIIFLLIFIGAIILVFFAGGKKGEGEKKFTLEKLFKSLRGDSGGLFE